ncbi:unnamed protein product [Amoebophrya sp. A120]|nr:unnamed protein product [Amoebophrya sp. A120]|eukprot:GSA120T00014014001.1
MNYQQSLQRAIDLSNKAAELDNQASEADKRVTEQQPDSTPSNNASAGGKWNDVLHAYITALENWQFVLKYENNPTMRTKLKQQVQLMMERAEKIKKVIKGELTDEMDTDAGSGNSATGSSKQSSSSSSSSSQQVRKPNTANGNAADQSDTEVEKLKKSLEGAIVTEKPNVRWTDIAGLDQAKSLLQETVILPVKFPQLFTGKRKPWKGILLYGPPGTGKSHLAKAVATEAESTFFSLSSSDLVSKWQGESEKMVKNLFTVAREQAPACIFIDEIDSMCGSRGDGESESSRRIKTEFLVQMQGVGNDTTGILMLGATNCPWDLDSAIRRRFEKRIYIPLPDLPARRHMVDIGIGDTPNNLSEQDKMLLAERTEGFSAADVGTLCKDALFAVIHKCMRSAKFKQVVVTDPKTGEPKSKWTPCDVNDGNGVAMKVMDIASDELLEPVASLQDFLAAVEKTKPSVGAYRKKRTSSLLHGGDDAGSPINLGYASFSHIKKLFSSTFDLHLILLACCA